MIGIKKLLITLILLYVLQIAYCQSYEIETSSGVEIRFTSTGNVIIDYKSNNKNIELVSDLSIRSILLSDNKMYISITSGEDSVGRIQIFDNSNNIIIDEYYAGKEPLWKNNSIEYEAVLWIGEGFTVREKQKFENGKIRISKQYIGEYHGLNDNIVDPLCPNYSLNMYGDLDEEIGQLQETIMYWEQKMKLPSSGIGESAILKKNFTNVESIIELVDKIVGINNRMVYKKDYQFYSMRLFNHVCIIVGKAYQKSIIGLYTKNALIKKMLTSMRIDENIAPWLFK
jgi:hypothetical protein